MPRLYLLSTKNASRRDIECKHKLCHVARMDQGKRIKRAREARALKQTELARRIGVKSQQVNKWEHNVTTPSTKNLKKLGQVLNVSVAWLLYGLGQLTEQTPNVTIPPLRTSGAVVPMVSLSEAAEHQLPDQPSVSVHTYVPIDGDACAVTLTDDSNAPEHRAGDIWALAYDEKPKPGDLVLGRHGDDLAPILGVYSVEATAKGRVRIISPKNTIWPAARSDIEHVEVVAVMVADIRPRRR